MSIRRHLADVLNPILPHDVSPKIILSSLYGISDAVAEWLFGFVFRSILSILSILFVCDLILGVGNAIHRKQFRWFLLLNSAIKAAIYAILLTGAWELRKADASGILPFVGTPIAAALEAFLVLTEASSVIRNAYLWSHAAGFPIPVLHFLSRWLENQAERRLAPASIPIPLNAVLLNEGTPTARLMQMVLEPISTNGLMLQSMSLQELQESLEKDRYDVIILGPDTRIESIALLAKELRRAPLLVIAPSSQVQEAYQAGAYHVLPAESFSRNDLILTLSRISNAMESIRGGKP